MLHVEPEEGSETIGVEAPWSMAERHTTRPAPDWLAEKTESELEWPAFAGRRPRSDGDRRQELSDRVRYLFPRPDDADWSIGDFAAQRKRNRAS